MPAVSTVVMLAILLTLGTWQLRRREWKHALLARIDAAEAVPGIPLDADPAPFAKVRVTGTLRPNATALYGAEVRDTPGGQQILGAQLLAVLDRAAGPVLVDRGWVDVAAVPAPPNEPVTIDGFVRPPEHLGMVSAQDDPANHRFWTLDPVPVGASLGVTVPPFTVVALGPPGLPDPAREMPRPPDNHLNYALTWYGFAVTLLIIFVLYARKALRS